MDTSIDSHKAPSLDSSKSGIYAIRNGERAYIGSAIRISGRWRSHRSQLRRGSHHNIHLQRAWNLYGEDAFEFVILEECPVELLLEREQYYLDSYSDKYNLNPTAGSQLGYRHTEETKAKMSANMLGNQYSAGIKHTPEARANMGASRKGNKDSDETRARKSAAQIGNTKSLGKKRTTETRAKLSAALIGNQRGVGHVVSPEARAKIGAATRARAAAKREAKIAAENARNDS